MSLAFRYSYDRLSREMDAHWTGVSLSRCAITQANHKKQHICTKYHTQHFSYYAKNNTTTPQVQLGYLRWLRLLAAFSCRPKPCWNNVNYGCCSNRNNPNNFDTRGTDSSNHHYRANKALGLVNIPQLLTSTVMEPGCKVSVL